MRPADKSPTSCRKPSSASARDGGLIGYNAPAYFAYILPAEDHIRIGFEWGALLPDPADLLGGNAKQVR